MVAGGVGQKTGQTAYAHIMDLVCVINSLSNRDPPFFLDVLPGFCTSMTINVRGVEVCKAVSFQTCC